LLLWTREGISRLARFIRTDEAWDHLNAEVDNRSIDVVTHNNVTVATTEFLAGKYGTEPDIIRKNFQRNPGKFTEGVHYFKLTGRDLNNFLSKGSQGQKRFTSQIRGLFLWTERGALNHARILQTDEAWEQHDVLVDTYFKSREASVESMLTPDIVNRLINKISDFEVTLKDIKPKLEIYETLIESKALYSVTKVAQLLGIGRNRMFKVLSTYKYIYKDSDGLYNAYQDHVNTGRISIKAGSLNNGMPWNQVYFTFKGVKHVLENVPYNKFKMIPQESPEGIWFNPEDVIMGVSTSVN